MWRTTYLMLKIDEGIIRSVTMIEERNDTTLPSIANSMCTIHRFDDLKIMTVET